jgi:hypothetical protein
MSDDDLDMPRPPQSADDWSKYAYYVLEELKASRARDAMLDKKIEDMLSAQSTSERTLLTAVTALKERSGWVGFIGGLLPALGFVLWELLKKP